MKKKALIVLLTLIFFGYSFWLFFQNSTTPITHLVTQRGYQISFEYNQNKWDVHSYDKTDYEYLSFIKLKGKEGSKALNISFSYTLQNNGDDTPKSVGDTGAGLFPPQPEELIFDFDPEYKYLGIYLGKKLYVTPYNNFGFASVVQELNDGRVAGAMPLLSEDQDRVNYYDNFGISVDLGSDPDEYEELYKEFIKILKTLKIKKIDEKKPE